MVYATENSRDRGFQLDPADIEGLFEVQGTGWSGDVPKHTKERAPRRILLRGILWIQEKMASAGPEL